MPNINDRIGSQNVIRVLSNASAPPTRLVNLTDVDSTLKTRDGMILVWDLATESFYMTDTIDSSSLNITGIVTFSNTTNSTAPANGALVVKGGIGVAKQVNIGGGISVAGIATFASNLDINAAVDILNQTTVNSTFKSVGVTTLASAGGITTTGGDLYVGGDLYIADDLTFDEFNARNANITGIATIGTTLDVNGTLDVDGRTELDTTNISQTLSVVGLSTFGSNVDINADLDVDGRTELDNTNIAETLNVVGLTTFGSNLDVNADIILGDGNAIRLGDAAQGDLQIFHDGFHSYILDDGDGNLRLKSNNIIELLSDTDEVMARLTKDGGVELFFNDSRKFETSGVGITVTGRIDTDQINVSGASTFTGAIDADSSLHVQGISTFIGNASFANNVSIAGTLTYEDVTNVDAIGLITARSGLEAGYPGAASTLTASGDLTLSRDLHVAGLSTFVGIATFSNNVFVFGTLTAGLIDGGEY